MESENLKSKITQFVKGFRESFNRLLEEEKKKVSPSFKVVTRIPCQITVVWMQEPTKNRHLQVFFFTHFEDLGDLQIEIVGPFKPLEFSRNVKNLLNEDRWSRKVVKPQITIFRVGDLDKPLPGEEYPYSSLIEKILAQAYIFFKKELSIFIYQIDHWIIHERFQDKDIESFIKTNLIRSAKTTVSDSSMKRIKCQCTYFFPPCWIGPKPAVEFEDRLKKVQASKYIKSYNTKLKDKFVRFESNGSIALETENWEEALKLINLLMAVISISGRELISAGRWDLVPIVYEEYETNKYRVLSQAYLNPTERSKMKMDMYHSITELLSQERKVIPLNEFVNFLKITEILFDNDIFTKSLLFYFESLTEYSRDKYPQALILSWITIERYINMLWQSFLKEKGYKSKRLEFLKDFRTWTAASKIELFNVIGVINQEDYDSINKYRKARNDFVHDKKTIKQELALECLEFTKYIIFKILGESENQLIKDWIKQFRFIN